MKKVGEEMSKQVSAPLGCTHTHKHTVNERSDSSQTEQVKDSSQVQVQLSSGKQIQLVL